MGHLQQHALSGTSPQKWVIDLAMSRFGGIPADYTQVKPSALLSDLERRLSVATRQIALSAINGTASVTPNFAAGMQTNCTNPNTYQLSFSTRSVLPLAVGGGFWYRTLAVQEKTIRTPSRLHLPTALLLKCSPQGHLHP